MKRPAFQWYPGDFRRDTGVQACTFEARALWREMLDLMHDGEPRGYLNAGGVPITPDALARIVGVPAAKLKRWLAELEERHVFSRTDDGVIYSRRMVRDERVANARAAGGGLSLNNPNVPRSKKDGSRGRGKDGGKDTFRPSLNGTSGGSPAVAVAFTPPPAREVGEVLREKLAEPHNIAAVERFLSAAPNDQRAAAMEAKLLTWLSGHDWPPGPKLTPNAAASGLAEYLDQPGDFSAAHVLAFLLRTVRQWHKHSEQLASGASAVPAKAQQEAQSIWTELKRSGVLYASTTGEWQEMAAAIAKTDVVKSVEHFGQIWREFDLPFLRAASTERAAVAHVAEALSRVQAAA